MNVREFIQRASAFLAQRRTAYVRTFFTPHGEQVLIDLARFCRAHESTFAADPRAHAVAEGRREVWLRIERHLRLSDEQLWSLYGDDPKPLMRKPDDE